MKVAASRGNGRMSKRRLQEMHPAPRARRGGRSMSLRASRNRRLEGTLGTTTPFSWRGGPCPHTSRKPPSATLPRYRRPALWRGLCFGKVRPSWDRIDADADPRHDHDHGARLPRPAQHQDQRDEDRKSALHLQERLQIGGESEENAVGPTSGCRIPYRIYWSPSLRSL